MRSDLVLAGLRAADKLWFMVYDAVRAMASDEPLVDIAQAVLGWRDAYEGQQAALASLHARVVALDARVTSHIRGNVEAPK